MAWTQAQLDALDAAIAGGVLTVRYSDRAVTYRSLADMLALRDRMAAELADAPRGQYLRTRRDID